MGEPHGLSSQDILGEGGRIAQRLSNYEHRPQQLEMAEAVERAIANQEHLVVEAGTGVGKSFGYLAPAILAAAGPSIGDRKRTRVVVSTHTISLQEQLIQKDLPFLRSVMPVEFSAVLVKGRSNYLSLRRMAVAAEKAGSLLPFGDSIDQLKQVIEWTRSTSDGSLSDLPFKPNPQVWDEVQSEHGNCLGKGCPRHEDCFYFSARRRVWNADILVVNHALFFADLALRRAGASLLPDYHVVVFDEAHTLEQAAGDHLGLSVSRGQMDYSLNRVFNDRTRKGLIAGRSLTEIEQATARAKTASYDLFDDLRTWQQSRGRSNGRVNRPPEVDDVASPVLKQLAALLREQSDRIPNETERIEFSAAGDRIQGLGEELAAWLGQQEEDHVYWIETSPGPRGGERMSLSSAPLDVGPVLRDELFAKTPTVILASATLSSGKKDFRFIRDRVGLTKANELRVGSPFDYRAQAKLILLDGMPDPGSEPASYEAAVCEQLPKYIGQTMGRAFVLFTSYKMMQTAARRLQPWLREKNLNLLVQGDDLPRSLMLERFRSDPSSVLFGADSFWQGVDVPGDALTNVIIAKLPFASPDHPLLEARVEQIRERGGNPFMEYQTPEAVLKLKQGFGRLIRSKTDTGQVVILDPRVRTKRYGQLFLDSLPDCRIIVDRVGP